MKALKKIKFNNNFIVIFFLGFSSGLPIALILSTLKAFLTDKGFDIKTIGFLSLVTIPYSIKFLFAPFIDSMSLPFLTKRIGQRKSWILINQVFLAVTIFFLGQSTEIADIKLIALFASLVAFFSASQDVVIDAYRIELFESQDQGLAASFYTFGYRIALLISGAFALFLADQVDWIATYNSMSLIMILCVLILVFSKETRIKFHSNNHNFILWLRQFVVSPLKDFTKKTGWLIILLLIIFFKLGDIFASSLTMPFLLELGFSKTEIAKIVKTFGLVATLLGAAFGGIMVKKIGIKKSLWIAIIVQMMSNLAFAYLANVGYNIQILYLTIFAENFSSGIGDAVFVAYLSSLCNIKFSATQYATLSSFASLSRSLISSSSGIAASYLGWINFFIFSTFLSIPTLLFLFIVNRIKNNN